MSDTAAYVLAIICLVGWGLGVAAISLLNLTRSAVRSLQEDVGRLKRKIDAMEPCGPKPAAAPAGAAKARPQPRAVSPPVESSPLENEREKRSAKEPASPRPAVQDSPKAPDQDLVATALSAAAGLEETLTSRWLVWLGGIALALGGAFLVKVSIDQGWFTPTVRVLAGLSLAALLVFAGEWLRRRPLQIAAVDTGSAYVPAALTGAGLFTAFGSLYAAYALYDLIPSTAAFLLLAGVAGGAIVLSLRQGPFIAVLGVIGAYAVPALIGSPDPSVWALFPYLMIVAVGGIGLMHFRPWWWLSAFTLLGATVWAMAWLATEWQPGDGIAIGLYLMVLLGLFFLVRRDRQGTDEPTNRNPWMVYPLRLPDQIFGAAAVVVAVLIFVLVRSDGYSAASLVTLAAFSALCLTAARYEPDFDLLPALSAALTITLIALWQTPYLLEPRVIDGATVGPVMVPESTRLILVAAAFAALYGIAGFAAVFKGERPAIWAALSVVAPILLFFTLYGLLENFERDWRWAVYSLLLAPIYLAAAERVARQRVRAGMDVALGIYGVGVASTVSLAIAVSLFQAWLTLALALQVLAIAWVYNQMRIEALRAPVYLLIGAVLIRLLLNPKILIYPIGEIPVLNWLLYAYGGSAAAFAAAARLFRNDEAPLLTTILQAAALVVTVALINLEIHSLLGPDLALDRAGYDLLEQSLQSLAWIGLAIALAVTHGRTPNPVLFWGWRILAGLAAAQTIFLQVIAFNPMLSDAAVGDLPIVNLLLLGYGIPAVLFGWLAHIAQRQGESIAAIVGFILSLVLVFVWLSLEVRHGFHGSILTVGPTEDVEWYAYSVSWLIYAGGLLALGIWRGSVGLRWASLVVIMLTVAKVFLFDMAALHGIYGALSLLGLGGTLVGIGYLYQRFVFPPRDTQDGAAAGAAARVPPA